MNDELKDFWVGFCGFRLLNHSRWSDSAALESKEAYWVYPDNTGHRSLPALTLDNLFKWAVPRVKADIPELKWAKLFVDWLQDILYDGKEPVTSLYERIQKVRSQ